MKSLIYILILFLTFCVGTFAQTDETSPCPTIEVMGPAGITKPGDIITFTASISEQAEKFNLEYKWTVSGGKIIEGQGTLVLRVLQKDLGETPTATLEVIGLPKDCVNTDSDTIAPFDPPSNILVDEFSLFAPRIDKARLDNLLTELQNNPNAAAYIIEKFKHGTSQKLISEKLKNLNDYLSISKKFSKDRIVILTATADENLTQFWIVPAGAKPPTSETSPCPTIEVTGPANVTAAGETMTFTANVSHEKQLIYDWKVSAGTIIEGQGTPVIKVVTPNDAEEVSATVEIKGLPENCSNTDTEKVEFVRGGDPAQLDAYENLSFKDEMPRLSNIAAKLKNQKGSIAYFIIYVTGKQKKETVKSRIAKIKKYLTETQNIPEESFVFVFSESDSYRTMIYLIPPGATSPAIDN